VPDTPLCVDVERAAAMIGLSPTVVRAYIDQGLLPVVKFPSANRRGESSRRVLIAVSDLQRFVEQYRTEVPR
jgi:hypothetical protein